MVRTALAVRPAELTFPFAPGSEMRNKKTNGPPQKGGPYSDFSLKA
jgi:hypothetical protein